MEINTINKGIPGKFAFKWCNNECASLILKHKQLSYLLAIYSSAFG